VGPTYEEHLSNNQPLNCTLCNKPCIGNVSDVKCSYSYATLYTACYNGSLITANTTDANGLKC